MAGRQLLIGFLRQRAPSSSQESSRPSAFPRTVDLSDSSLGAHTAAPHNYVSLSAAALVTDLPCNPPGWILPFCRFTRIRSLAILTFDRGSRCEVGVLRFFLRCAACRSPPWDEERKDAVAVLALTRSASSWIGTVRAIERAGMGSRRCTLGPSEQAMSFLPGCGWYRGTRARSRAPRLPALSNPSAAAPAEEPSSASLPPSPRW